MGIVKKIIAVYPGRFHPFHKGHYASYMQMVKEFGQANVIVATSGKTDTGKSPFSFEEKREMMILAGVPANRIVYTANPYLIPEVVGKLSDAEKDDTAIVFGVSEKDMAEDPRFTFAPLKSGKPGFYRRYENKNKMEGMGTISSTDKRPARGYIFVTKTVTFNVLGKPAKSASELRKQYSELSSNEEERKFIRDLFGNYSATVHRILNKKLKKGSSEQMNEDIVDIIGEAVSASDIQKMKDAYGKMSTLSSDKHRSLSTYLKRLSKDDLKKIGAAKVKFASAMAYGLLEEAAASRPELAAGKVAKWLKDNLSLPGWAGPDEVVRVVRKARWTGPGGSYLKAKMNNVTRRPGETHKEFAAKVAQACEKKGLSCKIIVSGEDTNRKGELSFWVDFTVKENKIHEEKEMVNKNFLYDSISKAMRIERDLEKRGKPSPFSDNTANKKTGGGLTPAQIRDLKDSYANIKTIDPDGPSFKKLVGLLDRLDMNDLKKLANADIKFVSSLALNRVMRQMRITHKG